MALNSKSLVGADFLLLCRIFCRDGEAAGTGKDDPEPP